MSSSLHYSQKPPFLFFILSNYCLLLLPFLQLVSASQQPYPPQHFSHSNLIRTIDLSTGANVRETISVAAENKHSHPLSDYYVAVPSNRTQHVAYYSAKDKATGEFLSMIKDEVDDERGLQYYKIALEPPLAPTGKRTLTMRFVHTRLLEPYPRQVSQLGRQKLLYTGSVTYVTPYVTEKQKTVVRLPSDKVVSFTDGLAPVVRSGASITYGPYDSMESFTFEALRIHFESIKGILVVKNLLREFHLSHWGGNAAVEEHYSIHHAGARLQDQFNRVQYQLYGHMLPETSIVQNLSMYLPAKAADPYYRDEIGNVSTSHFRVEPFKNRSYFEMRPRYPLYGGWNYTFYMGYNMPIGNVVKVMETKSAELEKKGQYVFRASFVQALEKMDAAYENVEVKVVLPEGSTNIAYSTPFPLHLSTTSHRQSVTKTYLDTIGRPTVHLTATNVVSEAGATEFEISYDLPLTSHVLRKPLTVAAAVFAVFAVGKVASRVETRIGVE